MNETHIFGALISGAVVGGLQVLITGYAFRLNHRYGTPSLRRTLYIGLALLSVAYVARSVVLSNISAPLAIGVNCAYTFILGVLFAGMLRLESKLKNSTHKGSNDSKWKEEWVVPARTPTISTPVSHDEQIAAMVRDSETSMVTYLPMLNRTDLSHNLGETSFISRVLGREWVAQF